MSNFGLLDQIAALQWVKENIGEFGGDASSVTLMGHGTGAACINFLMVSPVSMASDGESAFPIIGGGIVVLSIIVCVLGLFHKAILMSGTALSDWALTVNPLQFTIQVAEALNCPLIEENDELSNCLRKKRLSEIMSVRPTVPEFQTVFGPVIDGSVVPNTPSHVMGIYQDLFTRYGKLCRGRGIALRRRNLVSLGNSINAMPCVTALPHSFYSLSRKRLIRTHQRRKKRNSKVDAG